MQANLNRGIISDILLWVVLLGLCIAALYYGVIVPSQAHRQLIEVSFKDANEITRGSMVRMMGVEIGYVEQIELKKDRVNMWIKTYPDSPKIPSGSTFTIQFTGLVGAKSIEVIPPKIRRPHRHGEPQYFVEEPIRLKDTNKYQIDIARALQRGAENFSDFFGKKKSVEELQFNIDESNQNLMAANQKLIGIHTQFREASHKFSPYLDHFAQTANDFAISTTHGAIYSRPSEFKETFYNTVRDVSLGFVSSHAALVSFQVDQKVLRMQETCQNVNQHLTGFTHHAEHFLSQTNPAAPPGRRLEKVHAGLCEAEAFLQQCAPIDFTNIHSTLQTWNWKLEHLNRQLNK